MPKSRKASTSYKLMLIVLWPLLLMTAGLWLCRSPHGFQFVKVRSDFDFAKDMSFSSSSTEEFLRLRHVFSQPFHFLSSGAQCYAFVSDDGRYVIKFFKMHQLTPKYWLNKLPFPFLEKYRFEKVEMRKRRREETFGGFIAALEDMPDETGLVFVHFTRTHYPQDLLQLIDKKGQLHRIPLNQVPFVLQRRAEMIYPYVADLIDKGDKEKGLSSLVSILVLIRERCKMGFADRDDGVSSNYGFLDGKPVEIDLGRVVRDESMKESATYLREVLRVSGKMNTWLEASYPELSSSFQERVQRLLKEG
jgi:hypothetical protein